MLASEGGAIGFDPGRAGPELRLLHGPSRPLLPLASFAAQRDHAAERFFEEARAHRACHLHLHRDEAAHGLQARWPGHAANLLPSTSPVAGLAAWCDRLAASPTLELSRPGPADRTLISTIRRQPAMAAAVTAGYGDSARRPGSDPFAERVIALLYGVAGPAHDLAAILEETRSSRGTDHFAVSTPAGQAARILGARHQLDEDGPAVVSVHIIVPGRPQARRVELALLSGVARMSCDGLTWERSVPEDDWADLFEAATSF